MLQNVGCDFKIDSGAMEDHCGVCHGNDSTCHTVSGTFEEAERLGMGWNRCWGGVCSSPGGPSPISPGPLSFVLWSPPRLEMAKQGSLAGVEFLQESGDPWPMCRDLSPWGVLLSQRPQAGPTRLVCGPWAFQRMVVSS